MTDRNIRVEPSNRPAVEDQQVEIVERKGMGHPDSICDGVAEAVSRALAREYRDRVGRVLHYNTDETQLVAGDAATRFGGGEVIQPVRMLIVGRATKLYDGRKIPTETITLEAARKYLTREIPRLTFGEDIVVDVRLGEGSGDLQEVFSDDGIPMANDTSFGVGHAPLTETERIVRTTERKLNTEFAQQNPALGPDVKVMGKREGDAIDLTVATAIIDEHVADIQAYRRTVDEIREFVRDVALTHTDRTVDVYVNTADDYEEGSIYLTVTGTSAEQGDDGSVGRGNRANGLITPNRSMSLEATSGKNPVNHIGKIYNLLATDIAETVVADVPAIRDLRIRLLSQIGKPIDQPHVADAEIVPKEGIAVSDVEEEVTAIIDEQLADVTSITDRVIEGEISTF